MAYFLGIDGGGTRTTAWLTDGHGKVLAKSLAGPSNPLKVGFETAQREILRAARASVAAVSHRRTGAGADADRQESPALGQRRYSKVILDAVCAGLAGVDRPQVHRRLFAWLRRAIPARHHLLTVDAATALEAALGDSPGIIVIAGTGSIAYGRDQHGNIARAGGWGIPFDDLGSGYDLGRKAIAAALQDFDDRGRHTLLTRSLCRALKLENITQVVLKQLTQQEIAGLFPLVLEAARRQDGVSKVLCYEAGMNLAELAQALIERFGWRRRAFSVVCAGGVLKSSAAIRAVLAHCVRALAPRAKVTLLRREPVEGALALARALVGVR